MNNCPAKKRHCPCKEFSANDKCFWPIRTCSAKEWANKEMLDETRLETKRDLFQISDGNVTRN